MTFYSHRKFIGFRCCGCGKSLWQLMANRRWCDRRQTMLPVCAGADLAFIGRDA